jgi:hypothetical protein
MVLRAIVWVTADSAYGQEWHFRRLLEETALGYVVTKGERRGIPAPPVRSILFSLLHDGRAPAFCRAPQVFDVRPGQSRP